MKLGDKVMFDEEIQIKRCCWGTIERLATIMAIYEDGTLLLAVQCVPPKKVMKKMTDITVANS